MISPHRSNRTKTKAQDGRRLRRYERRWIVERFFAWLLSGNDRSWSAGNTTRPTFSASSSLQLSASCSDSFEIGSSSTVRT
jgi:hypothetical protein